MKQIDRTAGQVNFDYLGQEPNLPAKRSSWNRISGARPEARPSAGIPFLLIGFCLACLQPTDLVAQTVLFSGAIRGLYGNASENVNPAGVAVDRSGNVYFTDTGQSLVEEIVAVNGLIPNNPTIMTLGSGFKEPNGVAVDASGNVFVADTGNNAVKEMIAVNGSIPADPTINTLDSAIDAPFCIAIDRSGNVFVADSAKGVVLEILAVDGSIPPNPTIDTLASGFGECWGIAVDGSGNVFVSDSNNNEVKEILAVNGSIPPNPTINILGSGFGDPLGVAVDGNGNVFVCDIYNAAVKEMVAVNGSIPPNPTIIALGEDVAGPYGVAVDGSGNVFVAVHINAAVNEFVAHGDFGKTNVGNASPFVLSVKFYFGTNVTLGSPAVLTQGASGLDFTNAGGDCTANTVVEAGGICFINVAFTPTAPGPRHGAVELIDSSGNLLATSYVLGAGMGPRVNFLPGQQSTVEGGFVKPYGTAVDGSGDVFFADYGNNSVEVIESLPGHPPITTTLGSGFSSPAGIAIDGSANLFVADSGHGAVKEIREADDYSTVTTVASGFSSPLGVAVDGSANVFVADSGNGAVKEILAAGGYETTLTIGSGFSDPVGVAVDGSGNVFVADYLENAVKEIIAVNGRIPVNPTIKTLGSGFSGPSGVAVDVNGNVLVTDTGHNEVKEMVAVNGSIPSSPTINILGSGYAAPVGLAVEAHGNIYVADSNNQRIEELDYADPPSLQFATTKVGSISSDSPQSVTLVNGGNTALNAVPPGLSAPADFKLVAGSGTPAECTGAFSLASGASCKLSIEFAPLTAGNPLSESLAITDNSFNAGPPGHPSQSILLSGTAIALTPAAMTLPAAGSTLTGISVPFTWTSETGATQYYLSVGSTGMGSTNLYNSGWRTVTTWTADPLPTNGETLYVRLSTDYSGTVVYKDYTYKASTQAAVTSPTVGSILTGPSVTFNWSAATGATQYYLSVGSTGVGSTNVYNSGWRDVTSWTATGLPTNGETLYVMLSTDYNGLVAKSNTTYKAATAAVLTTPAPGSTLSGSSVTFDWTAGTAGATEYSLSVGSTGVGSSNIYNSGWRDVTSWTATGLPTNGETLYVRLSTNFGGTVVHNDYTYTAH